MKIRSLSLLLLSLLLLSMFFLTACGTLEISVETRGRSHRADTPTATAPLGPAPMTPTPTPWDYVLPTPEVASTPVPVDAYEAPAGLRIAFVREGDVWLWTAEEREAIPLTVIGDAEGDLRISDDGQLVAFLRGWEELWMVSTDGTGERPLVTSGEFGELGPDDAGAILNRFEWVAGTHILAFNTRLPTAIGQTLNHDLHLLDADSLRLTTLIPSGEGGEFYHSPDGSQIALVTPNEISLIDADGENRRDRQRPAGSHPASRPPDRIRSTHDDLAHPHRRKPRHTGSQCRRCSHTRSECPLLFFRLGLRGIHPTARAGKRIARGD
jgi:hypothetical protein